MSYTACSIRAASYFVITAILQMHMLSPFLIKLYSHGHLLCFIPNSPTLRIFPCTHSRLYFTMVEKLFLWIGIWFTFLFTKTMTCSHFLSNIKIIILNVQLSCQESKENPHVPQDVGLQIQSEASIKNHCLGAVCWSQKPRLLALAVCRSQEKRLRHLQK